MINYTLVFCLSVAILVVLITHATDGFPIPTQNKIEASRVRRSGLNSTDVDTEPSSSLSSMSGLITVTIALASFICLVLYIGCKPASIARQTQPQSFKLLTKSIAQNQFSNKHLAQIAIRIQSKQWKIIAAALGLSQNDINDIDIDEQFVQDKKMAMLRRWKAIYERKATNKMLLEALLKIKSPNVVLKEVCDVLNPITVDGQDHSVIHSYASHIREVYKSYIPAALLKWPPLPTYTYVTLAMILREKISYGKVDDEFIKFTLHGQVDDILFRKKKVQLDEIFTVDSAERKVILIEGAPGAGKSTLAWHICKEWQCGKLFQEYKLIVFVQFRDPHIQSAHIMRDILPPWKKGDIEAVLEEIEETNGEGVLFLLDGWDELPSESHQRSIFQILIESPHELLISKSAVIITTRPVSSASLQPLVSSRIEIVGFMSPDIHHYFNKCLEGDELRLQKLIKAIEKNPMIESACYLPLNAAIIVVLFLATDSLPSTLHNLFASLIFQCILRYTKQERKDFAEVSFSSLNNLPPEIRNVFDHLCHLAFHGVKNDLYVFSTQMLIKMDFPLSLQHNMHLGLMQAIPTFLLPEHYTYNFLHLAVQELLAAIYISKMNATEQLNTFNDLLGHPRFFGVFQFYAGITKLKINGTNKILKRSTSLDIIKGTRKRIGLLRCLYEAQDQHLCSFFLPLFRRKSIHSVIINIIDCQALGFFVSSICYLIPGEFKLKMRRVSLRDLDVKFIAAELAKCLQKSKGYLNADLSGNCIHGEGVKHISQLLSTSPIVRKLNLSDNNLQKETKDGLHCLCMAIAVSNCSLVDLNLSCCSLKITENNGPRVIEMLQKNLSLRTLILSFNENIEDDGMYYIAQGLKINKGIKLLRAEQVGMTKIGANYIGEALEKNYTLAALHICCNYIDDLGLTQLAKGLAVNRALKNLHIRNCGITAHGLQRALQCLPKYMYKSRLKVLNCSYNDLTGIDGKCFARLNLSALYLQKTRLCDKELAALCTNSMESLRHLDLQFNSFQTESGLSNLAKLVEANPCLVSLRLNGSLSTTNVHSISKFILMLMHKTQLQNVNLSLAWQDILQKFNAVKKHRYSKIRFHYYSDREVRFSP